VPASPQTQKLCLLLFPQENHRVGIFLEYYYEGMNILVLQIIHMFFIRDIGAAIIAAPIKKDF
jgi:hypothetical protein